MDEYLESEKINYDLDGAFRTADNKGYKRGMKEGMERGMKEGMKKGNNENARRMKADNMPTELIAKYTGLTVEDINSL